jgi:hypothetical protein
MKWLRNAKFGYSMDPRWPIDGLGITVRGNFGNKYFWVDARKVRRRRVNDNQLTIPLEPLMIAAFKDNASMVEFFPLLKTFAYSENT